MLNYYYCCINQYFVAHKERRIKERERNERLYKSLQDSLQIMKEIKASSQSEEAPFFDEGETPPLEEEF